MASMMKQLMDSFYDLQVIARTERNFEEKIFYETLESYANNCHGKSAQDTIDHVRNTMEYVYSNDENLANAYAEASFVLNHHEEMLR